MRKTITGMLSATLVAWMSLSGVASAAPQVIASEPEDGSTVHGGAPSEVSITFDMPLDPNESTVIVLDECGRRVDNDSPEILANRMTIGIAKKPSGRYEVHYRAVPPGGATGSTNGAISFTVHGGPSCGPGGGAHGGHGSGGHGSGGHDSGGSGGHGSGDHGSDGSGGHGPGDHGSGGDGSTGSHGGHDESTTHAAGSTHTGTDHEGHGGSGQGGKHGKHSRNSKSGGGGNEPESDEVLGAAPGGTDPVPLGAPTGGAIALSLLLCAAVGIGGGYLIRQTGRI